MVATALERIIKFVNEEQTPIMKKWSERYSAGTSRPNERMQDLVKKIRSLLRLFSGDDVVAMLKGAKKY